MAGFLSSWFELARIMVDQRRAIETLRALSDHHLADIGLERGDIDTYVRLGYPWPTRMPKARHDYEALLQGCG